MDIPTLREGYLKHVAAVKATVPAERLLVFRVTDGWEPLCEFLGVPVPDAPFPFVNDRATIRATLFILEVIMWTWALLLALPVLVCGCCVRRCCCAGTKAKVA